MTSVFVDSGNKTIVHDAVKVTQGGENDMYTLIEKTALSKGPCYFSNSDTTGTDSADKKDIYALYGYNNIPPPPREEMVSTANLEECVISTTNIGCFHTPHYLCGKQSSTIIPLEEKRCT